MEFRKIGKYKISTLCLQTYPCKHYVVDTEKGNDIGTLSGDRIFCMLRDEGISDPYFDEYAEFVRKRENPTPEELAERIAEKQRTLERIARQRKESEELTKKTNQYKASSYLEKLKAKHGVISEPEEIEKEPINWKDEDYNYLESFTTRREEIVEDAFVFPIMRCCKNASIEATDDGNRQQDCVNCGATFNANNFKTNIEAEEYLISMK